MVLDVVWGVVHGIRGACVLCNAQQYGCTLYLKLHLAYTALSLCGELYRRRQRLCSERECASSHYWLYPVATFEFRLWWLLLKSFRFQGRVESHIIWDAPALVTASSSGATCDICVHWETGCNIYAPPHTMTLTSVTSRFELSSLITVFQFFRLSILWTPKMSSIQSQHLLAGSLCCTRSVVPGCVAHN